MKPGLRIAVVGNADTVRGMGEYIDSFDIVVRINNGYNIPDELKKDIGSKVDIVYTCGNYLKQYKKRNFTYQKRNRGLKLALKKKFGANPTSGILAIYEMLQTKPKELFVTGISFYKKRYRPGIGETTEQQNENARQIVIAGGSFHDPNVDEKIFRILLSKNKYIILDNFLTEYLK